jgi:hypothetical protein
LRAGALEKSWSLGLRNHVESILPVTLIWKERQTIGSAPLNALVFVSVDSLATTCDGSAGLGDFTNQQLHNVVYFPVLY